MSELIFFSKSYNILVCVHVFKVKVKVKFAGISSCLPPCRSQRSKAGCPKLCGRHLYPLSNLDDLKSEFLTLEESSLDSLQRNKETDLLMDRISMSCRTLKTPQKDCGWINRFPGLLLYNDCHLLS